ncbi:uncharacterized protein LOC111243339 isoform X2 [Varroa destructor]|uniref:Transmembrane protein n=1 Tax=Varroa destructor TaxID=109461 RepID=A0A7M7IYR8_VARDE|nr:uncharacterized protein LOC111243339 isoform X2 [Varroa destructor]
MALPVSSDGNVERCFQEMKLSVFATSSVAQRGGFGEHCTDANIGAGRTSNNKMFITVGQMRKQCSVFSSPLLKAFAFHFILLSTIAVLCQATSTEREFDPVLIMTKRTTSGTMLTKPPRAWEGTKQPKNLNSLSSMLLKMSSVFPFKTYNDSLRFAVAVTAGLFALIALCALAPTMWMGLRYVLRAQFKEFLL